MVMIRTPKRVFTKDQRRKVKDMIDNLINLPMESNEQDDDLSSFVKHITRINKLIQEVVWAGGLLNDEEKYRALWSVLPNNYNFHKELLDKSWQEVDHKLKGSYRKTVQDFLYKYIDLKVQKTMCRCLGLPMRNNNRINLVKPIVPRAKILLPDDLHKNFISSIPVHKQQLM